MKRTYTILCLTLTLSLFTNSARANLSAPAGLSSGDHFYWVFVTSTGRDATSADIDVYNTFVNTAADNAGLVLSDVETGSGPVTTLGDINWKAIGSTHDVDAEDNIGEPLYGIYRLDGILVAANEAALWNTGSADLLAPISVTEQLSSSNTTHVWTGTNQQGENVFITSLGVPFSNYGYAHETDVTWVDGSGGSSIDYSTELPFYAISEELTVGNPVVVPLPGAFVLGLLGLMTSSIALAKRGCKRVG